MEWDAQSKPDETEQMKFAMTSNCLQYPAHFVGVFLAPPTAPLPFPLITSKQCKQDDTGGSYRFWTQVGDTNTSEAQDPSHWLRGAPGPPQTGRSRSKRSLRCWEASERLSTWSVSATSTVQSLETNPPAAGEHPDFCLAEILFISPPFPLS